MSQTRLSSLQTKILSYLIWQSTNSVTELAQKIRVLRPSVSRSLKLLRSRKLVNDFELTEKGRKKLESNFRLARDVKFHWFDCTTAFDCPCGNQEIFVSEDNEDVECECGRVYKFTCRLEVRGL